MVRRCSGRQGLKRLQRFCTTGFYWFDHGVLSYQLTHILCHSRTVSYPPKFFDTGADYGLLDCQSHTPLPDYYVAMLWANVMGASVLSTKVGGSATPRGSFLRAYAHCGHNHPAAGLAVLLINLANVSLSVDLYLPNSTVVGGTRNEYHLTGSCMACTEALLNNVTLHLSSNGQLPSLTPLVQTAQAPISVGPTSILFLEYPDVALASC